MSNAPQWLSLPHVAAELGVSAEHVRRLTMKAKPDGGPMLRSVDMSAGGGKRQRRIKREWLDAFLSEREAEALADVVQPAAPGRPMTMPRKLNPLYA